MTIRFAAAVRDRKTILARYISSSACLLAANDNGYAAANDTLVTEALHHFAKYGLAAANVARENALEALHTEDREAYVTWLAICRMLDRRMADDVETYTAALVV